MIQILLLLAAATNAQAEPNWSTHCDYFFGGYPLTGIDFSWSTEGQPGPAVRSTIQGKSHLESLTVEAAAPGERLHGWISKESPDNSVEVILYRAPQPAGDSKMVNHHVPFGQEVWGKCRN